MLQHPLRSSLFDKYRSWIAADRYMDRFWTLIDHDAPLFGGAVEFFTSSIDRPCASVHYGSLGGPSRHARGIGSALLAPARTLRQMSRLESAPSGVFC